ncbi:hypothetical protein Gotri_020821 [Gossypium trilobum]|uniref:DUF4283 domain-containing protein n=1 Tax=Gossypium trilobum TaxID=34281 RepID=A0A7J9DAJ7_9ROSI|nr:hypothetical protein [Gossypium trilobum]
METSRGYYKDGLENLNIQDGEEGKGVEEEVQQEFCLVGCFLTALVASEKEDPMEVPLTYSFFWVQVHDLLPEMMSKVVAKQLGGENQYIEDPKERLRMQEEEDRILEEMERKKR